MTRNRLLRLPAVVAALLCAAALAACGSGGQEPGHEGSSEGAYVETGNLIYQVQLSRELNPASVEDRQYLAGLSSGTAQPAADEEWFGVWLRVQNDSSSPQDAASDFKIVDTLGNEYRPIVLPATNAFSYQPTRIQGKDGQPLLPDPESPAGTGPTQGAMLLFKLNTSVYGNRPLQLEITPPDGGDPASVVLDL